MLTLKGVTKRYGSLVALDDVSMEIAPGEFFGLLGPNGAGKSTLMSLACGLRIADQGQVLFDGRAFSQDDTETRRQIGLVPQSIALYPALTAQQNLEIFGGIHGISGRELQNRINTLLEATQLADRRRDPVKKFSGGMQRRLNLAASLLHRPRLLLCDEPTVGVDPQSRNAIFDYMQSLHREGTTIIYSTHYMEEAERLCTRIGIIDHGKVLALGPLEKLLQTLPSQEEVSFPLIAETTALAEELAAFGTVTRLEQTVRFRPRPDFPLSAFFKKTEAARLPSSHFTLERPSLEAVFLHLTGRKLRD